MPRKHKYSAKFNPEWLQLKQHKRWLAAVEDEESSAWCTVCQKSFSVGSTGVSAIDKHGVGSKHLRLLAIENSNPNIANFFRAPSSSAASSSDSNQVTIVLHHKFLIRPTMESGKV